MTYHNAVLLIEPRDIVRAALLQAIRSERAVQKAFANASLGQALRDVREGQSSDVVFISNRFAQKDVLHFISAAKNCNATRDSAFILLIDQAARTNLALAKQLLKGMDGFLSFPFSAEMVQATIRTALVVKAQRMQTRVALASTMILAGVLDQLDYLTYDAIHRGKPLLLSSELVNARGTINAFTHDELPIYFDALLELSLQAKAPLDFVEFDPPRDNRIYSGNPMIQMTLEKLTSPDYRIRLDGLSEVDRHPESMLPYIGVIRALKQPRPMVYSK